MGSTFTVLLPVKSEVADGAVGIPSKEKTEVEAGRPNLAGLRVMIIEDDLNTMEVLNETLTALGAQSVRFGNAGSAFAAFAEEKPDVLVSDIAMPGEDGYSLIRKIRELGPGKNGDIPALALSAYATEGDVRHALTSGFDSHMAKPFDGFRLGRSVANLAKKGMCFREVCIHKNS